MKMNNSNQQRRGEWPNESRVLAMLCDGNRGGPEGSEGSRGGKKKLTRGLAQAQTRTRARV